MKLIYWVAKAIGEHSCYYIRAKTKKECIELMKQYGEGWENNYEKPKKVEVEFDGAFDLMHKCLYGEDRGYWE